MSKASRSSEGTRPTPAAIATVAANLGEAALVEVSGAEIPKEHTMVADVTVTVETRFIKKPKKP